MVSCGNFRRLRNQTTPRQWVTLQPWILYYIIKWSTQRLPRWQAVTELRKFRTKFMDVKIVLRERKTKLSLSAVLNVVSSLLLHEQFKASEIGRRCCATDMHSKSNFTGYRVTPNHKLPFDERGATSWLRSPNVDGGGDERGSFKQRWMRERRRGGRMRWGEL